jgi:hypothetical protein
MIIYADSIVVVLADGHHRDCVNVEKLANGVNNELTIFPVHRVILSYK